MLSEQPIEEQDTAEAETRRENNRRSYALIRRVVRIIERTTDQNDAEHIRFELEILLERYE